MAYERMDKPAGSVYHYTRRENVPAILKDGRIRRMGDIECWVCTSLEDTLALMRDTVMKEGRPYYKAGGILGHYPRFEPEDYVILKLEPRYQNGQWVRWNQEVPPGSPPELVEAAHVFSQRKLGYRGNLKFYSHPEIIEIALLLAEQSHQQVLSM